MKKMLQSECAVSEAIYEQPRLEIVCFTSVDLMAKSGGDENEGEWDPFNED